MIYKYSDFDPFMLADLPSCPPIMKLQALREAFAEFAFDTEAWFEELAKVDLVADKTTYNLNATYDGLIKRINWVRINGGDQSRSHYRLENERQLVWETDWVPDSAVTDGLQVKVTLYPDVESKVLDPNFMTRWFRAIVAKAKFELMIMPGKPWSNTQLAQRNMVKYQKLYTAAERSKTLQKKSGSIQVNLRGLTGTAGRFA